MKFTKINVNKLTKDFGKTVNSLVKEADKIKNDLIDDSTKVIGNVVNTASDAVTEGAKQIGKVAQDVADTTIVTYDKAKNEVIDAIDQNGNGEVDIEDVIVLGLKTPGIKINRAVFLKAELTRYYDQETINIAIENNPLYANIDPKIIDRIANEVIEYERRCVSGISAVLGAPGGLMMAATIPTDIAQYYGYMLRATQKLLYLYGFPEIDVEEKQQLFDSETINTLIVCMGVMYGVSQANSALKAMAKALGTGVQKQLMKKALTKGTIYPIVKSVSKWFGVKMTKEIFTGFFKKAIPVAGAVIGGGITYLSFKPCCDKLKQTLEDTALSNKNHVSTKEEDIINAEILSETV